MLTSKKKQILLIFFIIIKPPLPSMDQPNERVFSSIFWLWKPKFTWICIKVSFQSWSSLYNEECGQKYQKKNQNLLTRLTIIDISFVIFYSSIKFIKKHQCIICVYTPMAIHTSRASKQFRNFSFFFLLRKYLFWISSKQM